MPRKEYTSLPTNYPVCEHSDCPMAASCLHQIAHAMKLKTDELLRLINPTRCTQDASCAYYRSNRPMVYARGFTNFQRRMFPRSVRLFHGHLHQRVGTQPLLRASPWRTSHTARRAAVHTESPEKGWRKGRNEVRRLRGSHQLVRLTYSNLSAILE